MKIEDTIFFYQEKEPVQHTWPANVPCSMQGKVDSRANSKTKTGTRGRERGPRARADLEAIEGLNQNSLNARGGRVPQSVQGTARPHRLQTLHILIGEIAADRTVATPRVILF